MNNTLKLFATKTDHDGNQIGIIPQLNPALPLDFFSDLVVITYHSPYTLVHVHGFIYYNENRDEQGWNMKLRNSYVESDISDFTPEHLYGMTRHILREIYTDAIDVKNTRTGIMAQVTRADFNL